MRKVITLAMNAKIPLFISGIVTFILSAAIGMENGFFSLWTLILILALTACTPLLFKLSLTQWRTHPDAIQMLDQLQSLESEITTHRQGLQLTNLQSEVGSLNREVRAKDQSMLQYSHYISDLEMKLSDLQEMYNETLAESAEKDRIIENKNHFINGVKSAYEGNINVNHTTSSPQRLHTP